MTYLTPEEEIASLLKEAKILLKKAVEIATQHGLDVPWSWEVLCDRYLYVFKSPDENLSGDLNENNQLNFDFGEDY